MVYTGTTYSTCYFLGLSVFPAIIQRHCNLIRTKKGLRVESKNDICNCAKKFGIQYRMKIHVMLLSNTGVLYQRW